MPDAPALLVLGPDRHGAVRYGADVAAAVRALEPAVPVLRAPGPDGLAAVVAGHDRVHLHVTDRLLGDGPEHAARTLERLGRTCRLTVTLHDLPQPSDGAVNLPRRAAAYAAFVAASCGVLVNSHHEAALLGEHVPDAPARRLGVVPLGLRDTAPPASGGGSPADGALHVLVAGWVYPGKGHAEAIAAAAEAAARLRAAGRTVPDVAVVAVGAPSPGHEADVAALTADAAARGVRFVVTGSLPDDAFARACRAPGIPVAAHQHLSASRSLLDWVEQGRRALVLASRYTREMAVLRPGTTTLVEPGTLADALVDAWSHPDADRLPPDAERRPLLTDVAAAHLAWWAGGPAA